jgi:hypothetical protein
MSLETYRRRGEVIRLDILDSLIHLGPCTLADLVVDTGRSHGTVETQLRKLAAEGRAVRAGKQHTGRAPRIVWEAT